MQLKKKNNYKDLTGHSQATIDKYLRLGWVVVESNDAPVEEQTKPKKPKKAEAQPVEAVESYDEIDEIVVAEANDEEGEV